MNVPFLVKQYLSNDLEQGSFSKIFWYYPLKKELASMGGVGMFFEVLYGDVDYELYEQISKRFWDTFSDNYYATDFEQALRKSIQAFTQLLRGFGVEEGLDVNIVLFNAVKLDNSYVLKIITFGESDMYVIRQHKVADISKLVPQNKSLRDVKFLEVDLEEGDVLLLSNKTLLQNAFDSDIIAMDSMEHVLRSLEQFKENLFGNKKVFLVAALSDQTGESIEKKKSQGSVAGPNNALLNRAQSMWGNLVASVSGLIKKKDTVSNVTQPKADELDEVFASLPQKDTLEPEYKNGRSKTEVQTEDEVDDEAEELLKKIDNVELTTPSLNLTETTETTIGSSMPEVKAPIMAHSSDAVLIAENEDPMPDLDKLVPTAESEEDVLAKLPPYKEQSVIKGKSDTTDYVAQFRNMRSPMRKLSKQPFFEKVSVTIQQMITTAREFVKKLMGGKLPSKIFIGKDRMQKPKHLWQIIASVVLLVIVLVFYIQSNIAQANAEKSALHQYDAAVTPLQKFYDNSIVPITNQDPDNQLDLCFTQIDTVNHAISQIKNVFKSKESIQKRDEYINKVAAIKSGCGTKYDIINNIIRVTTATLVTDLKVSLGSDSSPVDMAIKAGWLVIADTGRKAIYEVNPLNSSIMKLEDPSSLITNPISVATGDTYVFICDKQSGVVYTDTTDGFKRIVGLEPGAIGDCSIVKGFGKNVYVVPATKDRLYRSLWTNNTFALPTRYIEGLADVRDVVIDGNIYIISGTSDGTASVDKYFAGKKDAFTLDSDIEILNPTSAYTNPSDSFDIYIYDKDKGRVTAIEKATARRHPGTGTLTRTFVFENKDMFGDIKDIVIDTKDGREQNMYVLNGSTIWKVSIPARSTTN